jgi:hypothetical protein
VSEGLLSRAWALFDAFKDEAMVRPSIPIAYFGDAEAYSRSPIKIVTVGLNPSRLEFPSANPFRRFPEAEPSQGDRSCGLVQNYRAGLDSYFRHEPYMAWFGSYEAILNGAGASYLESAQSIAVHTDICSPLSTDPTWNRLSQAQQGQLEPGGAALWHQPIAELQPNLIVASIAASHLAKIRFERLSGASLLWTVDRDRPFQVHQQWLDIRSNRALLLWGRPVNLPFGSVSRVDRIRIGAAAAKALADG